MSKVHRKTLNVLVLFFLLISDMKRSIIFVIFICCCFPSHAQVNEFQRAYDEFRNQAKQEYEDFRKRANQDYADFVRKAWESYQTLPAISMPKDDEIKPVIIKEEDKNKSIEDHPVVIDEIIDTPEPKPQPKPVAPIREQPSPTDDHVTFTLYGTDMSVRANDAMAFRLKDIQINSIASAWETLATTAYDNLIRDCLENRIRYQLSDWAYLQMLNTLANTFIGEGTNEAELLKAYLYCQSGYQMRLALADNHLYMLYASQYFIFDKPCWQIDGVFYYADNIKAEEIQICEATFPNEQALSLQITHEQALNSKASKKRIITAQDADWLSVTVIEDENLMAFYQDYPSSYFGDDFMTRWALYANTPLSQAAQKQLYPSFKEMFATIAEANKKEGLAEENVLPICVDMLCHWVQTAFVYEYDDKVWGHDRAFFADETLFYPYCDCEDRSILLTRLVRDLLGLKCALVYYPGHLATAIAIGENIKGDYIRINGIKYIVCDPTYIGASIGMTMPDMDNQSAKVIVLN